jgi:hypothetical protein
MQFARTSQTSIFKREFNASGWRSAVVIPSSQEWCRADAHHPRINGTVNCVCQYPAFSAGKGRSRNRDAGNFTIGASTLTRARLRACLFAFVPTTRVNHQSDPDMKNLFALPVIIAVTIFCSCQKQLTEAEIQSRIEREVKRQLAAEHEAEQKELDRRRAEFNVRRNAVLDRKGATGSQLAPGIPEAPIRRPSISEKSGNPATALSPGGTIRTPRLPPGVTLPDRAPGGTLPGRPLPGSRLPTPMPVASVPATSETAATSSVTSASSASPSFSPLSETAESASPTPTPEASDGIAQ